MEDTTKDQPCCWICMEEENLLSVCSCPRPVHQLCLAKWQVNNIGGDEENRCRFCNSSFPDWRSTFTIPDEAPLKTSFRVVFNGQMHKIEVNEHNYEDFVKEVRRIYNITDDQEFDVVYTCNVPNEKNKVMLNTSKDNKRQYIFQTAVHLAKCGSKKKPDDLNPEHQHKPFSLRRTIQSVFSRE